MYSGKRTPGWKGEVFAAVMGEFIYIEYMKRSCSISNMNTIANGRRLATPLLKGGGAYGYIWGSFCLLHGNHQYYCSFSEQKEITAPLSKCCGYLSLFIVLTICGECLCNFILPLYVRSFKNNIESPGDWMIAVIPCAFHWWCFGRREVRRRTFRQRAGEFIERANRGSPCHSTFLRTLNAVCQQPVQ